MRSAGPRAGDTINTETQLDALLMYVGERATPVNARHVGAVVERLVRAELDRT